MQLTFAFLSLHSVCASPLLSQPSIFHRHSLSCRASRFIHPVAVSRDRSAISQTTFCLFLAPGLHFTGNIVDQAIELRHEFRAEGVRIDRCRFKGMFNTNKQGGAVYSTGPVVLFNSHFDDCQGNFGGGLCCTNGLDCDFVTFLNCTAKEGGAVDARSEHDSDTSLTMSLFLFDQARYFGSVYRLSRGIFRLIATNVTGSGATSCVGGLESKFGSAEIRFSVLSGSTAGSHNGGICTRKLNSFLAEFCLFERCAHVSKETEAAAVLLLYENPYDSSLSHCAFVNNSPDESYTLTVSNGHALMVAECCFTGEQKWEINPGNIGTENCLFEVKKCKPVPLKSLFGDVSAGYDENLQQHPFPTTRKRTSPAQNNVLKMPSSQVFLWSVLVSVVITSVLTGVQTVIKGYCSDSQKKPKAFQ
jgi:hypothetical protein